MDCVYWSVLMLCFGELQGNINFLCQENPGAVLLSCQQTQGPSTVWYLDLKDYGDFCTISNKEENIECLLSVCDSIDKVNGKQQGHNKNPQKDKNKKKHTEDCAKGVRKKLMNLLLVCKGNGCSNQQKIILQDKGSSFKVLVSENLKVCLSCEPSIRISTKHTYVLTIYSFAPSHSGQYVCAVNMLSSGRKVSWAVLTSVYEHGSGTTITTTPTAPTIASNKPTLHEYVKNTEPSASVPTNSGNKFVPLYVLGVLLPVALCVAVTFLFMRKKVVAVRGFPYVVGRKDLQMVPGTYSVSQLTDQNRAEKQGAGQAEVPAEAYSIVRLNSLYEASPPQGDGNYSSQWMQGLAGNTQEDSATAQGHVYEIIDYPPKPHI